LKIWIAIALTLVLGSCGFAGYKLHQLYQLFDDMPEEASPENLNFRYADLVNELNRAIDRSTSAYSLASELENIQFPSDALYVAMQSEEDDSPDSHSGLDSQSEDGERLLIFDKLASARGSRMRLLSNGAGYGRINDQHFWILQHPLKKYGYEYIEMRFERETPATNQ